MTNHPNRSRKFVSTAFCGGNRHQKKFVARPGNGAVEDWLRSIVAKSATVQALGKVHEEWQVSISEDDLEIAAHNRFLNGR